MLVVLVLVDAVRAGELVNELLLVAAHPPPPPPRINQNKLQMIYATIQ